jgi:hypothetical protein
MLPHISERMCCHLAIRLSLVSIALIVFYTYAAVSARAQGGFSSGSTEADGPLNPPTQVPAGTQIQGTCPACTVIIPLRAAPNHVFNFTTINIPFNMTVTFIPNVTNTPVTMLASGNVTIIGVINVKGQDVNGAAGGVGGPGGGRGGNGGLGLSGLTQGMAGEGPGGGVGGGINSCGGGGGHATAGANGGGANGGPGGQSYGTITLLPLLGGSGGGGGGSTAVGGSRGFGGGGGGGAILIASSGNIIFGSSLSIQAFGGASGFATNVSGGGGSGGSIRVITNTITGAPTLQVQGGTSGNGGIGAPGFIRIEAFDYSGFFPNSLPSSPAITSFGLPQSVLLPPTAPVLRIASVAGIAAPASPIGSFQATPDIVVPSSQPNPVTVALEASNLPLGAVVDVTVTPEAAAPATVQSTPLSGTEASSTATASVTLSNVISVISAKVVINFNPLKPSKAANQMPSFIDGERVDRMEIVAAYGRASEITYVTASGRRVKKANP